MLVGFNCPNHQGSNPHGRFWRRPTLWATPTDRDVGIIALFGMNLTVLPDLLAASGDDIGHSGD
jgi:hypothetical protein